jgi:hypothetical protein
MDGRKMRHHRKRRHSGRHGVKGHKDAAVIYMGRRSVSRRAGGGGKRDMTATITATALGVLGALVGSIGTAKFAPASMNPKIRAALPLGAGLLLATMMRNRMIQAAGAGMAIAGGLAIVKLMAPTLPALAGVDDMDSSGSLLGTADELEAQIAALEHASAPMSGTVEQYAGINPRNRGWLTSANLPG